MTASTSMRNLVQGIAYCREVRSTDAVSLHHGVAALRGEARSGLHDLGAARQAVARKQRAALTRGRAGLNQRQHQRRAEAQALMEHISQGRRNVARDQSSRLADARAGLAQGEAARQSEVESWLHGVSTAHHSLARQQRATLAAGRGHLAQDEAQRHSYIDDWLRGIAVDHAGARREWQSLGVSRQTQRSGTAVLEEEEALARAEVGEVTPEFDALSRRVFDYLAGHPDGTRLTELEREFRLGRFEAARAVRRLIDEGKLAKRERLYFAI